MQFENDKMPTNKLNKAFEATSYIIVLRCANYVSS